MCVCHLLDGVAGDKVTMQFIMLLFLQHTYCSTPCNLPTFSQHAHIHTHTHSRCIERKQNWPRQLQRKMAQENSTSNSFSAAIFGTPLNVKCNTNTTTHQKAKSKQQTLVTVSRTSSTQQSSNLTLACWKK